MAKNKKKKEEAKPEPEFEEEQEDFTKEEDEIIEDDEEIIDSSLEIGGEIHKQSKIILQHPHLPKDTKYSNFGRIDIANYMLKSNAYQLWQYVKKIQYVSKLELEEVRENKKKIYDVTTKEQFKKYLEDNKKGHIWHNLINNFTEEEFNTNFKTIMQQLKDVKDDGVIDYIYSDRALFYGSYNSFLSNKNKSEDIDDFGLINTMMSLTEVNKARKGWATNSMNTTISITRDEDNNKDVEEEPEDSENKGFKSFIKK